MLKSLRIQNFRGVRDLQVGELDRINIFAGRNNAGKSTLLEAVFLLGGAGDAKLALNTHIVRTPPGEPPKPVYATLWTPLFSGLDTETPIIVSGNDSSGTKMSLTIELTRSVTAKRLRTEAGGVLTTGRSGDRSLKFTYGDSQGKQIESEARETADGVTFHQKETYVAFEGSIVVPGQSDVNAAELGKLRREKRGDLLLDPLRLVDPRVQTIEDNASSGTPVVLVDIGLRELVPLSVMGAGMTHLVRILLAAASAQDGVVLIDEIENGLHYSILADVWRVIMAAAEQFNVQVFATTHSFECLEAAHRALGTEGFRLHRLEVTDDASRCVTLSPTAIDGAIHHKMEVR